MKKKRPVRNLAEDRRRDLRMWISDIPDERFPTCRYFECRVLFSHNAEIYESRGELVGQKENHRTEALELAKKIFGVEGVQEIEINGYRIRVNISDAFNWDLDNIKPQVITAIQEYIAGKSAADEIIRSINDRKI